MQNVNGKKVTGCLTVIILCFVLIGCGQVYRSMGLTEEQTAELVADDQEKTIAVVEVGRDLFWQTLSAAIAGVGTITAAMLGKWLNTERRISGAMISGVEKADKGGDVKHSIAYKASQAGVGVQLARRVDKLTLR